MPPLVWDLDMVPVGDHHDIVDVTTLNARPVGRIKPIGLVTASTFSDAICSSHSQYASSSPASVLSPVTVSGS